MEGNKVGDSPQKKLVGLLCVVLWSYTTIVIIQEGLVILAN